MEKSRKDFINGIAFFILITVIVVFALQLLITPKKNKDIKGLATVCRVVEMEDGSFTVQEFLPSNQWVTKITVRNSTIYEWRFDSLSKAIDKMNEYMDSITGNIDKNKVTDTYYLTAVIPGATHEEIIEYSEKVSKIGDDVQ